MFWWKVKTQRITKVHCKLTMLKGDQVVQLSPFYHWLVLCTFGLCIVNVHWCRSSEGFFLYLLSGYECGHIVKVWNQVTWCYPCEYFWSENQKNEIQKVKIIPFWPKERNSVFSVQAVSVTVIINPVYQGSEYIWIEFFINGEELSFH